MKKLYMTIERKYGVTTTRYFRYAGRNAAPKKGEYYLSGAQPEVWEAPNGLTMVFNIMEEFFPKERIVVDGIPYRIDPR